jgi:DNA-binding NarL/FixJ family response regulator
MEYTVTSRNRQVIFLTDSDAELGSLLERTLKSEFDVDVVSFVEGRRCLRDIVKKPCDVLISNTSTAGMDGVDVLVKTKRLFPAMPVIMIGNELNIDVAVHVMKMGAFDCCAKPFDRSKLLSMVEGALSVSLDLEASKSEALTPTEQKILRLLMQCKSVKEIARIRSRSARTIEDQRQAIMRKLGASGSFDLIRRVGLVRFPQYLPK